MSAITTALSSSSPHLRPFDIRRDLDPVANLVETCFADTLDEDGKRYVRQMHSAARNPGYLRWASAVADHASIPLSGFVWEEDGKVVGNLSLIPFLNQGRQYYLIANVAVDPGYRRQGIARALTETAMEQVRNKGVSAVWLHVREENIPAYNLYASIGFVEKARRTTWDCSPHNVVNLAANNPAPAEEISVGKVSQLHWPQQRTWMQAIYPPELSWHIPLNLNALRNDLWGILYRFFSGMMVRQWAAVRDQQLLGVLVWRTQTSRTDQLWVATGPEYEDVAIPALLARLNKVLPDHSRVVLEYPARRGSLAFSEAGFRIQQTLIWMEAKLK